MCGIFGIVSSKIDRHQLEASTNTLSHKGPDDSGFFVGERIGVGHRGLSIIDLEGEHQPIFNEDDSKLIGSLPCCWIKMWKLAPYRGDTGN